MILGGRVSFMTVKMQFNFEVMIQIQSVIGSFLRGPLVQLEDCYFTGCEHEAFS